MESNDNSFGKILSVENRSYYEKWLRLLKPSGKYLCTPNTGLELSMLPWEQNKVVTQVDDFLSWDVIKLKF